MVKKILVPIDGSDHAKKAIEFGGNTALQYDAAVYLLHVVAENKIPEDVLHYIQTEKFEDAPESVYLQIVAERITKSAEEDLRSKGVKEVHSAVLQGDPAEKINEYSREKGIDMIIIGSRGLGSFRGLLLGSVSSKVCHTAECTCMTVK
jgi:nucleotide-binding universal stress UspA family protein